MPGFGKLEKVMMSQRQLAGFKEVDYVYYNLQ